MDNEKQKKRSSPSSKCSKQNKDNAANLKMISCSPETKETSSANNSPNVSKKRKLTNNQSKTNSQCSINKTLIDDKDDEWDDEIDQDKQIALSSNLPNYTNTFGVEEVKSDPFKLSVAHINLHYMVIDEICLEGLDGITLEALWTRISIATKQSLPFPIHIERFIWSIIKSRRDIEFYKLQKPRERLKIHDRYQNTDPDLGATLDPVVVPKDIYPYSPVKHNNVLGSATSFVTQQNISVEVRMLTLEEAQLKYGSQLIMVGTQKMRQTVLMNPITDPRIEFTSAQYCLLERIGRSREHGEVTQGKVSLQIITKDPKILFYNRKILQENKLITKQTFHVKVNPSHQTTGSLLHLYRFHNERKTKTQIMTEQVVEVLRDRPFYRMEYTEAKLVFGRPLALKKLFKLQEFQKFVRTDVQKKYRELYPDASIKQWKHKASDRERTIRTIELINPNVNVSGCWNDEEPKDESSDDEETRQIVYNVPLLHQVYNYIKTGGPQGRSLKEIQHNKGLDFYTIRATVKKLLNQNVIVGIKLDVGRQRMMKYQTLTSAESEKKSIEEDSPTQSSSMHKQLTNESIDFLSNLLGVDPEYLYPLPEVTQSQAEGEREEHVVATRGYHTLIKKLHKENRQGKQKKLGYESKGGESLLNQLLSHKEKLILDATHESLEDVRETDITSDDDAGNVDASRKQVNSSMLEMIFKNQHKYEAAKNCLPPIVDSECSLKEICAEMCISAEIMNRAKNRKRKKSRRRLISKIRFESNLRKIESKLEDLIDYKDLSTCPLKFLSEDLMLYEDRYHRFRNKMLKIVKPILSHFKYRITVLKPKKRFMCRQPISKSKLAEFSLDHPMLNASSVSGNSLKNNETFIIDSETQLLKRKVDDTDDIDSYAVKRLKLDDSAVNESISPVMSSIYMGPKPNVVYHFVDDDNIEITIIKSTTPEEFDDVGYKYIKDDNATLRTLKRASHIVDAVRQEKVITDIHKLHKMIETLDKEDGYMVKVDKKSMDRIYTRLVRTGHIIMLHIDLKLDDTKRNAVVICDPSISISHTMINSVIEQMKVRFFLTSKRKEQESAFLRSKKQEGELLQSGIKRKDETAFDSSEITNSVGELKQLSTNETSYIYNRNVGKDYGFAPKFMRLRLLHEFLFYVIYGFSHNENIGDVKQALQDLNVIMNEKEIEEMPQMYCKEISWRSFIPPLPKHNGWPEGWALVCDLLLRLPLSLFVKIYNVSYIIPDLPHYLEHPIKQFYLIKHLPLDIRNALLLQRKYIFNIHESFTRLCYIGILQFGPQKLREKDQLFIYLNRNATLLDTTTNTAGYHHVEEKEYRELKYNFSSAVDVERYWSDMWSICAHSKLGVRNIVTGTYITIELVDSKPAMIEAMKPKTPETALSNDNGFVPGDRLGAAGLDSALWPHIKRNWNWSNRIIANKSHLSQKDNSDDNIFKEESKVKTKNRKSTKSKLKSSKKTANVNLELDTLAQSCRRIYKNTKIVVEKKESVVEKKGKYYLRKVLPRSRTAKKKDYDSIDKRLMAALKQSRSEWSENEDKILQICQIVTTFLCPNPRKHFIPYTVIRDTLHQLSPSSVNKTSSACHRRINVTFGSQDEREFLQQIVKSLRFMPFIKKYVLKTVERIDANASITEKQLYGIFVFLVTYFVKHQHEISHIIEALACKYNKVTTNLQKTREEHVLNTVHNTITRENSSCTYSLNLAEIVSYQCIELKDEKPKVNKLYPDLPEFPRTEFDVAIDTIKSIIHSTVGTKQEEISWSYQLFRIYQNYSDEQLRTALSEIQNAQMVTHKKIYNKRQDSEGLLIMTKLFQFSFNYSFAQITNFPSEIFVEAHEMLLGLTKYITSPTIVENNLAMECFEQGHSVGLAEISTNINIHFNVDIPKEVLLLNPNIADHTDLIRELAERYKKMLTLVKQGKYFKEEESENQYSNNNEGNSGDQVDTDKQEKIKNSTTRQPMIQRFLKSWFLSDDVDDVDEDPDNKSLSVSSKDESKKGQDEKKNSIKLEKRKKHFTDISSQEGKKILQSLNPNLFSENEINQTCQIEPSTRKNNSEPLHSITGNELSFEDYERKLENLLSNTAVLETDNDVDNENINDDESLSTNEDVQDSSLTLADFNDTNTSILEKYLSSIRRLADKSNIGQDVVDSLITQKCSTEKLTHSSNTESDVATNARIQYLMSEDLTVEQIMEQMLEECPLEDRKVPKPVHLARLLVKGLFPELDEDEERLEQLHQHFLIICPDTNLSLLETVRTKEFDYLAESHVHVCKNLLKKVQMDIIISDNLTPTSELMNELKKMGNTDIELKMVENLIDFVNKRRVIGATVKQLKEQFPNFQKLKLSTILNTLTEKNILIRAGINHLVYVHHKFRKHWLIESCTLGDQDRLKLKETETEKSANEDLVSISQSIESLGSYMKIKLKVMPWARIDGTLNLKVFEKWMSTVLGHCLSNQMIPLKCLMKMCCYSKPVDVYYLVECLQEIGCVKMLTYETTESNLFSTLVYKNIVPVDVTHDFENIFIETDPFAVIKLGALLNKKLKEFEFPSDEARKHGTF